MKRRIWSLVLCFCMVVACVTNIPMMSVSASNTANDLVSVAKGELGNGYSKYTHYVGAIGGRYDYAWCAAFVSWCGNQAGVSCICKTASCYAQYQYMTTHGGYEVSNPQAGDVVFFYCDKCSGTTNKWCHIGIMINSTTSIDGNYYNNGSSKVSYDNSYSHYGSLGYKHSSGIKKIYVRPNYGTNVAVLPGTIDSSWDVPANVTASHKITTYDQWGNPELNHYIDPGDNCYISEVYTNGFVKVQYPTPSGKRWAYGKTSDFPLSQKSSNVLPDTTLSAWFSTDAMGKAVSSIKLDDTIFLCYRLETKDGNLLSPSIGNYTVKETICFPDGSSPSYSYNNSNNNWVRTPFNQWGSYRGIVEISGDYTGKVELTYNLSKDSCLHRYGSWTTTKKATCTADGTEQRKCSLCGKTESRTVKATGHKYTTSVVEATYTEKGYTLHKCTTCGNSYKDNYTDVKKKQLDSISITKSPNTKTFYCNDKLDTTGMRVTASYSDGTKKEVTGWNATADLGRAGQVAVKVSYSEGSRTATATYSVTVKEKPVEMVTITYDPKGGTLSQTTQKVKKNSPAQLISEKPVKKLKVTFDANGGSVSPASMEIQQKFVDWTYSDGTSTSRLKSGQAVYASGNGTASANYESAALGTLPTPEKKGYEFLGWYQTNGSKAYVGMTITSNCSLIAKWKAAEVQQDLEENDDEDEEAEDTIEIGDEIVTDEAVYTVTKLGESPCVEYSELFDDEVRNAVIPSTITENCVTYSVTSIGAKAFYKNTSLRSVTIEKYVTKIGSKAFYGCTNLKKIVIKSEKLKSGNVGSKAFTKVSQKAKAYVPKEKYSAYKKILKKAGIGSKAKIYKSE